MTTGAGESLGEILAVYDDPLVIVETVQAVPEAVENFDEIVEALPAAIEEQQAQNNPHDPGDRYDDDFRLGWDQGYFAHRFFENLTDRLGFAKSWIDQFLGNYLQKLS